MMLCYVCPTSGRKVAKFLGRHSPAEPAAPNFHKLNKVRCPDCGRVHDVWDIGAWMTDAGPPKTRKRVAN